MDIIWWFIPLGLAKPFSEKEILEHILIVG
jgi:hypothetical protein